MDKCKPLQLTMHNAPFNAWYAIFNEQLKIKTT